MAFLDNSGDIILDAVLTDTGRMRLAKGDGSFKITKFALGDDEIDYSLYDHTHASGSAYYDLNILITPVLEAFTNNASSMKSKLISISRTNLLYLPVLKLNQHEAKNKPNSNTTLGNGSYVVAVDSATETAFSTLSGILTGFDSSSEAGSIIRIDQGLHTSTIAQTTIIDNDLKETQYIIEIDNRLGTIQNGEGNDLSVSYIDDDNIASYYVSSGTDTTVVDIVPPAAEKAGSDPWVILGPQGTKVTIDIRASLDLSSSDYLFTTLGGTGTATAADTALGSAYAYKYIDTNIRVTGATTGASIDIPVRFVKND